MNEHEFAQLGNPSSGLVIVTAGAAEVVAYENGEVVAKSQPQKSMPSTLLVRVTHLLAHLLLLMHPVNLLRIR